MLSTSLRDAWQSLPNSAQESIVSQYFIAPHFLKALGFEQGEIHPQYATGQGSRTVDYALRKNTSDDIFIQTQTNPYLLIELKGRDINLALGTAGYNNTVKQLKDYLLSPRCTTAQWGIITNSIHIQLFRKHGKVIHPATPCLEINIDNIGEIISNIRLKIEQPKRALTVAIYNNKGGVGKTTTTINLASALKIAGQKNVLVIDLDPNQQDLTHALGLPLGNGEFRKFLTEKHTAIQSCIHNYAIKYRNRRFSCFDVIPADQELIMSVDERDLRKHLKLNTLEQKLEPIKSKYDYILIDSPPNWRVFSQLAVIAADVVLIPTKHNNMFSLENAALAIQKFIPEAQEVRNDGCPIPLPVFFNGERITESQKVVAHHAIDRILSKAKAEEDGFDLLPYFYPKSSNANKNREIFEVPGYANIANSAFSRIPAAYRDKTARAYYINLAKEYFLQ